jgi:para-nitrobenzyl esterase
MKKGIALSLMVFLAGALLAVWNIASAQSNSGTKIGIVSTKYGKVLGVKGLLYEDVTIFKGIPYAAPPVGELRWKPPQEPEPWQSVRNCVTYAPAALQNIEMKKTDTSMYTKEFYWDVPAESEDCLYLNVATAAVSAIEKRPVFIWFHGGGLGAGWSYEPEFDPEALAKKGIIVVSVGQRLGPIGYMVLPGLSEESGYGASGNYGLMDEITALKWVKQNIKNFGGDPDNITVGGQSGGTAKTTGLLFSPEAKGMFHQIILQSGLNSNMTFSRQEEMEKKGLDFLEFLGLPRDITPAELRKVDASRFMGDFSTMEKLTEFVSKVPASMVIDGKYLTRDGKEYFLGQGTMNGIRMIYGSNLGESQYTKADNAAMFYDNMKKMLGDLYKKYDFENLVKVTDATANDTARILGSQVSLMRGRTYGDLLYKNNQNVAAYCYLFSHFPPGRDEEKNWAWHSGELWYMFNSIRNIPQQRAWEDVDYALADTMSSYWANFIAKGDPNGKGLPAWPECNSSLAYLDLGDKVVAHTDITRLEELIREYVKANPEAPSLAMPGRRP